MSWAWRSVGNPGCGWVVTVTGSSRRAEATETVAARGSSIVPSGSTSTPIAVSRSSRAISASIGQFSIVTSPLVIAVASISVPASIRSAITRCSARPSERTPSITSRGVPAPPIRAPIADSRFATSTTSGSQAACSITVVPSAMVAALMTLIVPSTVEPNGPPRNTRLPFSRSALTWM